MPPPSLVAVLFETVVALFAPMVKFVLISIEPEVSAEASEASSAHPQLVSTNTQSMASSLSGSSAWYSGLAYQALAVSLSGN